MHQHLWGNVCVWAEVCGSKHAYVQGSVWMCAGVHGGTCSHVREWAQKSTGEWEKPFDGAEKNVYSVKKDEIFPNIECHCSICSLISCDQLLLNSRKQQELYGQSWNHCRSHRVISLLRGGEYNSRVGASTADAITYSLWSIFSRLTNHRS